MQTPEVQQYMADMIRKHREEWAGVHARKVSLISMQIPLLERIG